MVVVVGLQQVYAAKNPVVEAWVMGFLGPTIRCQGTRWWQ